MTVNVIWTTLPDAHTAKCRVQHMVHTNLCRAPCRLHARTWQHIGGHMGGMWSPRDMACCMSAHTAVSCRTRDCRAGACSCCKQSVVQNPSQLDLQLPCTASTHTLFISRVISSLHAGSEASDPGSNAVRGTACATSWSDERRVQCMRPLEL